MTIKYYLVAIFFTTLLWRVAGAEVFAQNKNSSGEPINCAQDKLHPTVDSLQTLRKKEKTDTNKVVVLQDSSERIYLSRFYLKYFADTIGNLTINDVRSENFSAHFKRVPCGSGDFATKTPEKSKVFWLRFTFKNEAYNTNGWYLDGGGGDTVQLFYPNSRGDYLVKIRGDNVLRKDKEIKTSGGILNLPITKEGENTVFIRLKHSEAIDGGFDFTLIKKDSFWEEQRVSRYINGAFLGIMLTMIFINLVLFFSVRDRSYLYYIAYLFCISLFILSTVGFVVEFLPFLPNGIFLIRSLFFGTPLFYILFGKNFLQIKKYLPRWNKVLNIYIIGLTTSAILVIILRRGHGEVLVFLQVISMVLALVGFFIVLIPAILCLRKGYKPAKYFLTANIALVLVMFIMTILIANFFSHSENFRVLGFQAGAVMEAIIFSLGLNYRLKLLEKEKQEAQEKALIFLEQKVEDRTAEVVQQKHIVEEKNKDITDSITYAKRIQRAMLPHRRDIWAAFPHSFVLFKPKDIVSGDFYFFHKNEQSVFIAVADCTGHGVPGAFMSMVGSERLTDAVHQSDDPSQILSLLNKGVKTSLHQTDSETSTRDGMDIALCAIDLPFENGEGYGVKLKYSGANRPIWIIRKGQTEVEEIKATKKAIGGFTIDEQRFESHELKLRQGDTFYISTDGYADQFGGLGRKKLMTKKFKEILLEIQDKTMQEQEKYLDNFVENWKAGTEQVDDILVIGIRLRSMIDKEY